MAFEFCSCQSMEDGAWSVMASCPACNGDWHQDRAAREGKEECVSDTSRLQGLQDLVEMGKPKVTYKIPRPRNEIK